MQGVSILAIGSPTYGVWAYNLAKSIKHFHPDMPIQLVYEHGAIAGVDRSVFDCFTEINPAHSRRGGRLTPSYAKLNIYEYLPDWEKVMILDADTICMAEFDLLFDQVNESRPYAIQTWGTTLQKDGIYSDMMWMRIEKMRAIFDLPDQPIPGTNSSFQLLFMGGDAEAVYSDALDAYHHFESNFSIHDMHMSWGRNKTHGVLPDELFFNASLARRSGYDGLSPIKFHQVREGSFKSVGEYCDQGYCFLGLWGDKTYNNAAVRQAYDMLVKKYTGKAGDAKALLRQKFVTRN